MAVEFNPRTGIHQAENLATLVRIFQPTRRGLIETLVGEIVRTVDPNYDFKVMEDALNAGSAGKLPLLLVAKAKLLPQDVQADVYDTFVGSLNADQRFSQNQI